MPDWGGMKPTYDQIWGLSTLHSQIRGARLSNYDQIWGALFYTTRYGGHAFQTTTRFGGHDFKHPDPGGTTFKLRPDLGGAILCTQIRVGDVLGMHWGCC